MGIIAGALFAGGYRGRERHEPIPFWVVLCAHAAIGLGTLSGGWRIVQTMGSKITKLQPVGGFAAETARRVALTATRLGVPVSTTHTITGAIVGVGPADRLPAGRWGAAGGSGWARFPGRGASAPLFYGLREIWLRRSSQLSARS